MTASPQPPPFKEAVGVFTANSFPLVVRKLTEGLLPTNAITSSMFDGGPGDFSLALVQSQDREKQVNALLNIQPTLVVGLSMDASGSMQNEENDVRKNMAPWLVNTIVINADRILAETKQALEAGLDGRISAEEKARLMQQGLKVIVRTAVVGDSRLNTRFGDPERPTLIDDPPLEMVIGEQVFKPADSSHVREEKARDLLNRITNYRASMYGGGNEGESIPEGIAAVAGIASSSDALIPLLGDMVRHYEKYGHPGKIQALLSYLRGLIHLETHAKSHQLPADLLIAATDEQPPEEDIVVDMPAVSRALSGRSTPTFIITPESLKSKWDASIAAMNARHLILEKMSSVGEMIDNPLKQAVTEAIQHNIINELKLLTG